MLTIDPMHNLYLGTAKYVLLVKFGLKMSKVNDRVLSIIIPPEVKFNRLPACLQYPSSLTAEQWMLWVNYYSVFCLYDIIPPDHLECWRHFVLISRLLCKCTLSLDDIKLADALLFSI